MNEAVKDLHRLNLISLLRSWRHSELQVYAGPRIQIREEEGIVDFHICQLFTPYSAFTILRILRGFPTQFIILSRQTKACLRFILKIHFNSTASFMQRLIGDWPQIVSSKGIPSMQLGFRFSDCLLELRFEETIVSVG